MRTRPKGVPSSTTAGTTADAALHRGSVLPSAHDYTFRESSRRVFVASVPVPSFRSASWPPAQPVTRLVGLATEDPGMLTCRLPRFGQDFAPKFVFSSSPG